MNSATTLQPEKGECPEAQAHLSYALKHSSKPASEKLLKKQKQHEGYGVAKSKPGLKSD